MPGNPAAAVGEMCGAWICTLILVVPLSIWLKGDDETPIRAAALGGAIVLFVLTIVAHETWPAAGWEWSFVIYGSGAMIAATVAWARMRWTSRRRTGD